MMSTSTVSEHKKANKSDDSDLKMLESKMHSKLLQLLVFIGTVQNITYLIFNTVNVILIFEPLFCITLFLMNYISTIGIMVKNKANFFNHKSVLPASLPVSSSSLPGIKPDPIIKLNDILTDQTAIHLFMVHLSEELINCICLSMFCIRIFVSFSMLICM